eukprot:gene8046-8908_t
MMSDANMKLLKMPDMRSKNEDEHLTNAPPSQLLQFGKPKDNFKFLKLPHQSADSIKRKPVNLVQIPLKSQAQKKEISLIRLPAASIESESEPKANLPFLINVRDIQSENLPKNLVKLLQMPKDSQRQNVQMIKVPVSMNDENRYQNSRLIDVPVKDKIQHVDERSIKEKHVESAERYVLRENQTQKHLIKAGPGMLQSPPKSEVIDKRRKHSKRKRRKKKQKSDEPVAEFINMVNENGKIENKSKKISKETQTTAHRATKKRRKSRQKVNLMSLLEQAAFLFDSDDSEQDSECCDHENQSHLDKEEFESIKRNSLAQKRQNRNKVSSVNFLPSSLNENPKSSEQLLLENFHKIHPLNTASLMENSELGDFLAQKASFNETDLRKKQQGAATSHMKMQQNENDVMYQERLRKIADNGWTGKQITTSTLADKPKCAAGIAWKEVVDLSRESVADKTDVLPNQKDSATIRNVDDGKVGKSSREQIVQTDFTFATDATTLLLNHSEKADEVKMSGELARAEVEHRSQPKQSDGNYPWEYIGRVSLPELTGASKVEKRGGEVHGDATMKLSDVGRKELTLEDGVQSHKNRKFENDKTDGYKDGPERITQAATGVHFPSDILLDMRINENHVEATEDRRKNSQSNLLNVVDISAELLPQAERDDGLNDQFLGVDNEIPIEKLSEDVEIVPCSSSPLPQEDECYAVETSRSSMGELRPRSNRSVEEERDFDVKEDSRIQRSDMKYGVNELDKILAAGPKDRINCKLRNLSVQLNALDDLHDHLEKELKSSALLMQTVDTLHHGFFEPDKPPTRPDRKTEQYLNYDVTARVPPNVRQRRGGRDSGSPRELTARISEGETAEYSEKQKHEEMVDEDRRSLVEEVDASLENEDQIVEAGNRCSESDVMSSLDPASLSAATHHSSNDGDDDYEGDEGDYRRQLEEIHNEVEDDEATIKEESPVANQGDEVRLRLMQKYPKLSARREEKDRITKEREIREKLESKRKTLQNWMKKKRLERSKMYRAEVDEKRQKESRPFTGVKSSSSPLKEKDSPSKQTKIKKKVVKEEMFNDRMEDANILMSDLLAAKSRAEEIEKTKPFISTPSIDLKKRKRQENTKKRITKERKLTTTQKLQQNSRGASTHLNGIGNDTAERQRHYNELKENSDRKWLIDNISLSWKDASFGLPDSVDYRTFPVGSGRNRLLDNEHTRVSPLHLDLSGLSEGMTSDLRGVGGARSSARHSVEERGREFVTEKSMEQYKMKNARLLRKSLREYCEGEDLSHEDTKQRGEDNDSPVLDYSFMTTLDMTEMGHGFAGGHGTSHQKDSGRFLLSNDKEGQGMIDDEDLLIPDTEIQGGELLNGKDKRQSSYDDEKDVNDILAQYGLLDNDMHRNDKSETSQLLAEANLILEGASNDEDNLSTSPNRNSVDWDELRNGVEAIWPLAIFLILAIVRTSKKVEYKKQLFFKPRAMPSAGALPFMQSFLCDYDNPFSNKKPIDLPDYSNTSFYKLAEDLSPILQNRTNLELISNLQDDYNRLLTSLRDLRALDPTGLTGNASLNQILRDPNIVRQFINNHTTFNETYIDAVMNGRINFTQAMNFYQQIAGQLGTLNIMKILTLSMSLRPMMCGTPGVKSLFIFPDNINPNIVQNQLCSLSTTEWNTLMIDIYRNIDLNALNRTLGNTDILDTYRKRRKVIEDEINQLIRDVRPLRSFENVLRDLQSAGLPNSNNTNTDNVTNRTWEMATLLCGRKRGSTSSIANMNSTLSTLTDKGSGGKTSTYTCSNTPVKDRTECGWKRITKEVACQWVAALTSRPRDQLPVFASQQFHRLASLVGGQGYNIQNLLALILRGKIFYTPDTPQTRKVVEQANLFIKQIERGIRSVTRLKRPLASIINLTETYHNTSNSIRELVNLDLLRVLVGANRTNQIRSLFNQTDRVLTELYNDRSQLQMAYNTIDLIGGIIDCYNITDYFQPFPDEETMVRRATDQAPDKPMFLSSIVFLNFDAKNGSFPKKAEYKLRLNPLYTPATNKIRSRYWRPGPSWNGYMGSWTKFYVNFGFVYLQDMLDRAIMEIITNQTILEPGVYTQQFPYPCYIRDEFTVFVSGGIPLFMVIAWVFHAAMIIKSIVYEKESRLKEVMKVMGLSNSVHWAAWFITSLLFILISVILLCIVMKVGNVLLNSNPLIVFWVLASFGIATISLSCLISVFFSNANISAACGGIIYLATYLPFSIIIWFEDKMTYSHKAVANLLSTTGLGMACRYLARWEEQGEGAQWSNYYKSTVIGDDYSLGTCVNMMLLDALLYMIILWYIENIMPGQYGIPRRWYFPFTKSYWLGSRHRKSFSNEPVEMAPFDGQNGSSQSATQACDSNFEADPNLKVGVNIQNLVKIFKRGNKRAVDGLSLKLYEGQVTSLLGHNGAGKSTTMSVLTGLYPPTKGTAVVYGSDIRTDIEGVRKGLGICPQHNVLFDHLTVEEHMWFYAQLKGMPKEDIKEEIEKFIVDVGLPKKRHELSRNLSGGMKRKLSVALAFIADSKTVILDEPTAGVDPYSRRGIWDLILSYKKGKTILLSTHYMDEADLLGDRIGIISHGRCAAPERPYF